MLRLLIYGMFLLALGGLGLGLTMAGVGTTTITLETVGKWARPQAEASGQPAAARLRALVARIYGLGPDFDPARAGYPGPVGPKEVGRRSSPEASMAEGLGRLRREGADPMAGVGKSVAVPVLPSDAAPLAATGRGPTP